MHVISFFKSFQKCATLSFKTGNLCNFCQFNWKASILSNVKAW